MSFQMNILIILQIIHYLVKFVKMSPNGVGVQQMKGYRRVCHQKTPRHNSLRMVKKFDSLRTEMMHGNFLAQKA